MTPDVLTNLPGLGFLSAAEGEVNFYFSSDPRPANDFDNNTFFLEADLGFAKKLIICIKPANPKRWLYDMKRMYETK